METIHQPQLGNGSRKRKSLAHFYDELNKDKKFSTEATVSSGFAAQTANANNNIPYSQQEAIAIGYAQYALMHTLTQQFGVNYPAAFLHAAAASGYLSLPSSPMPPGASNNNANTNKITLTDKYRDRRKQQQQQQQQQSQPNSDSNNNHIRVAPPVNHDQPYRRDTYQTLLESSRLLGQQKLLKPSPIDLRKHNGGSRVVESSKSLSSPALSH